MKRSNLVFFIEQIVDLSIANQSLCDGRRENETRIKELEKINDELLCPERMKALEIRNKDLKNAAKLYQKELVKAEKERNLLAEELVHLSKQIGYIGNIDVMVTLDENDEAIYAIKRCRHYINRSVEDIIHNYMYMRQLEEGEDDQEPTKEQIEIMQNDMLDEIARKKAEDALYDPRDYPEELQYE